MSPLTSQPLTMSNFSGTTTGNKGSLVISSTSSETVLSGGKIKVISGENKHYSPFRSRGKMLPLMNSSKSDEDDEEDEEDDEEDDNYENESEDHRHHHGGLLRGVGGKISSYASRNADYLRKETAGEDTLDKNAILAAKFPQKRNYMPPGSLGGGAGGGKIVASRYHHRH